MESGKNGLSRRRSGPKQALRSSFALALVLDLCAGALGQDARLPGGIKTPFLITYHVTVPPGAASVRAISVQQINDAYADLVGKGEQTPARAKSLKAEAIAGLDRVKEFDVTIASDGNNILYKQGSRGKIQTVVIYGKQSQVYEADNRRLELKPDFDGLDIRYWPYFPFNVPPLKTFSTYTLPPDFKGSDYYQMNQGDGFAGVLAFGTSSDKPMLYLASLISETPDGQIQAILLGGQEKITYDNWRQFGGVRLPASVTRQFHRMKLGPAGTVPRAQLSKDPFLVSHFELTSASDTPLPDNMFRIATYLGPKTSVITDGFAYHYSPGDGDFDKILDQQLVKNRRPRRTGASPVAGSVAGAGALLLIVGVSWNRFRKT